ncbi:MAG: FlgD immunoglobulin-like domain containing protein [Pseudomonadota bacterium]
MATEVKNQGNQLATALMKPKGKPGSNSGVIGAGFSELYKSMDAPRKTPSQLMNSAEDMDKAVKSIDEAMDFATQLLLSAAKNMGMPSEDGNDSKAREMSETAQSIATMMATKSSVQAQMQAIEQQKKPAIDLMSLKDKQVEYNDSKRAFFGKPVTYNYRISHNEPDPTASVNLTMTVRNEQGLAIKTIRQTTKAGEFSYEWDGKDDRGYQVPPGTYTLDLKAEGRKIVGGKSLPFAVKASASLVGKVEAVKIENGTATGVIINGKTVTRDNIVDVRDMPEPELEVDLTPDLIGRKVELDFSKAKVKSDGSMEVYFKNHVENPGDLTVRVYDEGGKFLTTLTSKKNIGEGVGKVSFSNTNLDAGVYDIKVFVQDKENPANVKDVELSYNESILVAGVSKRYGTVMSVEEKTYDPMHITSVLGNYTTPIEQRRAELIGSEIVYRDDLFKYAPGADPVSFTFKLPEEDAVISTGRMNIYDENTKELVATVNAEYDLNSKLDAESKRSVKDYIIRTYARPGGSYSTLSREEKIAVNRYIKNEIQARRLTIDAPYLEAYNNGQVAMTFPVWNGQDTNGVAVDGNRQLRRDFTPIYSRDGDGSLFAGDIRKQIVVGRVDAVDEVEGELQVHVRGVDGVIPEDLILSSRKV